MSEAVLVTYLNDHLGGAQIAVQLLEAMRDQHDDQDFRRLPAYCCRKLRLTIVRSVALSRKSDLLRALSKRLADGSLRRRRV